MAQAPFLADFVLSFERSIEPLYNEDVFKYEQ